MIKKIQVVSINNINLIHLICRALVYVSAYKCIHDVHYTIMFKTIKPLITISNKNKF